MYVGYLTSTCICTYATQLKKC